METGLSASDVALMNRDGCGWGDSSFMWIFALLILFWGGNGMFGNRCNEAPVTESALCNSMNFNNLENAVGRQTDQINNVYTGLQNGLSTLGYETLRNFNSIERQIADCCCNLGRSIDGVNYNISQSTAAINSNTTAAMQKILDTLCADKAAAQAARIQQLELNQALCGVVRYPTNTTYNAGINPYFNPCCCGA